VSHLVAALQQATSDPKASRSALCRLQEEHHDEIACGDDNYAELKRTRARAGYLATIARRRRLLSHNSEQHHDANATTAPRATASGRSSPPTARTDTHSSLRPRNAPTGVARGRSDVLS
jgi:hypothetical protein